MTTVRDEIGVEIVEGRAKLRFPKSSNVFYNPRMSINRDLAVLFANSYFPRSKEVRVCDPMAGSGVRAARYLLETPNTVHVVASDRDGIAAKLSQETMLLSNLGAKASVIQSDAYTLLSKYATDRFDIVDLDPFGSPAPYFESALRATMSGGIVAATATDMGPLSGARTRACARKYGISPVRTEFEKELAVRTLVSCLVTTASKLELGIDIAFSHATDHYARLYAVVSKGRKAANKSVANLGYISYCRDCLSREQVQSIYSVRNECADCSASTRIGGPFWLGPLWDRGTVESMIRHTPTLASSRLSEIQKILNLIREEQDAPSLYYRTDKIASAYHVKPPSVQALVQILRSSGHQGTRTHFNPTGFRTNAPPTEIASSFRDLSEEA